MWPGFARMTRSGVRRGMRSRRRLRPGLGVFTTFAARLVNSTTLPVAFAAMSAVAVPLPALVAVFSIVDRRPFLRLQILRPLGDGNLPLGQLFDLP